MIVAFLALVACGDKEQDTSAEEAEEVEEATEEESGDTGESEDTSSEVEQ
tara:strand:- start:5452 stop:5601 length:150 start_codon:yes stop_codon:yes gene_type:complete